MFGRGAVEAVDETLPDGPDASALLVCDSNSSRKRTAT